MCNPIQVYALLASEGREREFYPWYALQCLLMGQDCWRTAYTYNVKEIEPEVFRIIDGLSPLGASVLIASLLKRLREEPKLSDYVKALSINHLYLSHRYDSELLSGELLNELSRRHGWGLIGALLGVTGDMVETHKCVEEPSLLSWTGIRDAYRGVYRGSQK
jgi:hypothetical protein